MAGIRGRSERAKWWRSRGEDYEAGWMVLSKVSMKFSRTIGALAMGAVLSVMPGWCAPVQNIHATTLTQPTAKQMRAIRKMLAGQKPQAKHAAKPRVLLPAKFDGWLRGGVHAAKPPAADAAALNEFGFERGVQAGYSRGGDRVAVLVWKFPDATGAYGTFTMLRTAGMEAVRIGEPEKKTVGRKKPAKKGKAAEREPNTATAREVRKLADKLTKMNNASRGAIQGIGTRRSEIIVAGAQVYAEVLEHYRLPGFRYSEFGMRDGMLSQMLAEEDARTSAHQVFERDRWAGVLELARRYGTDPKQMEPVRQHAAQLFHDLAAVHGLPEEYQLWLEAAAVLRDVGKFLNYQGYHRHAQYIVANSELFGFTREQRMVTSGIARYLGKSRPAAEGRTMRDVPPTEQEWVRRAVVLLRLAVGLNQDRASDVLKVKAHVYPKRVILELYPGRTGAELELWSLRKEADYFREVFRRDLLVTLP